MAAAAASGGSGGEVVLSVLSDPNYEKLLKEGFDEDKILKGRIKTLKSKTFTVKISPDSTVLQLKRAIEDAEAVPISQQHFRYAKKLWPPEFDKSTLRELGITGLAATTAAVMTNGVLSTAGASDSKSVTSAAPVVSGYTLLLLIRDGMEQLKAIAALPTAAGSVQQAKATRSETMTIQPPTAAADDKSGASAGSFKIVSGQSTDASASANTSATAKPDSKTDAASSATANNRKPIPVPSAAAAAAARKGGESAAQKAEREKRLAATLSRLGSSKK